MQASTPVATPAPPKAVACAGRIDIGLNELHTLGCFTAQYVRNGFIITSGNNPGADHAFVDQANDYNPRSVELYLPWRLFEPDAIRPGNLVWTADKSCKEHIHLAKAASVEPWDALNPGFKRIRIRNAMLVYRFHDPVSLVIAYPNRSQTLWGNVGHVLRIAALLNIPCYLFDVAQYWDGCLDLT
jgi:hypothetical protein